MPELAKASPRGARVVLRAPQAADAERLFVSLRDVQVTRFLNIVPPIHFARSAQELHELLGSDESGDRGYVIAEARSGEALGGLRLLRQGSSDANISFWLGQEHWGRGFASDAIRTMARYALGELGIATFIAQVFGGNARSQALLGHLGFRYVRTRQTRESDLGKRQVLAFRLDHAGLRALADCLSPAVGEEVAFAAPPAPFDTIRAAQEWGSG